MADSTASSTTKADAGTPVTTTTSLVATTIVPTPNPLMEPKNYMELGGFLLMIAALWAIISKQIDKRRTEDRSLIGDQFKQIGHKLENQVSRIDQLERLDRDRNDRLIKVEAALESFKEGQQRMESAMKDNHKETLAAMDKWADAFDKSIREIRDVKPKA